MKTALLTASYLKGVDPSGSDRMARLKRFLTWHHWPFFFGMDFYVSDNGSPEHLRAQVPAWVTLLRHQEHLERTGEQHGYIYCWRHLYAIKILMQLGYEKIIFLDSDCFIVSRRMQDYVMSIHNGWEAFWIPKYNFPSAEFHVLCQDAFPIFNAFTSVPYQRHDGKLMETALPFTRINRDLFVDRWGEDWTPQEKWMDAYCQAPVGLPLEFNE